MTGVSPADGAIAAGRLIPAVLTLTLPNLFDSARLTGSRTVFPLVSPIYKSDVIARQGRSGREPETPTLC
jgi:hypothetical protein